MCIHLLEMDACRKGYFTMHYKRLLTWIDGSSSYLSVGLDVGADFTWMSIALPNGAFIGKPFKVVHSDPRSRDLAVTKIKEAQETYSLKSRCFLESTGIYHIPLLCFLRDKGFDCSVINPIITKNSTNINIRKLHNDKFDSKKAALVGLNVSLKASIIPEDSVVDLRNLVRDYYYFKDLQSAVALKLTAELKMSFPAYAKVFSKVTTQSSLKLLSSYPLAGTCLRLLKTISWRPSVARHVLAKLMHCVSMTPSSLPHKMLLFSAGHFPAMLSASAFILILIRNTRSIWTHS